MAEELHEEGIVPASALDFKADGLLIGMGSQDVEGKPPQNGEVFWRVVLSRAVCVLGKMGVEDPMKTVFDPPVSACDVQQPSRRQIFRQQIVANGRWIGALPAQTS